MPYRNNTRRRSGDSGKRERGSRISGQAGYVNGCDRKNALLKRDFGGTSRH